MNLESVPLSTLSFDPANLRKHGRRNLDAIKASLRRFGQQKPIVVDAKGIVLAGNLVMMFLFWELVGVSSYLLIGFWYEKASAADAAKALTAAGAKVVLAGRPKDLDDIRGVLAERGAQLKAGQVRETLALLEDALGQSDLLPVFEREFARWRSER